MVARGVPIHGVGMQTHWGARSATPTVDPATVAAQMKRLADLGLDVYDGDYADPPYLLRQDASAEGYAAPLLFDEEFRPKPAYEALAEVLRRR